MGGILAAAHAPGLRQIKCRARRGAPRLARQPGRSAGVQVKVEF